MVHSLDIGKVTPGILQCVLLQSNTARQGVQLTRVKILPGTAEGDAHVQIHTQECIMQAVMSCITACTIMKPI